MKELLYKLGFLLQRFFLFLTLHIRVEAGLVERQTKEQSNNNEVSDDPEKKEKRKGDSL